MQKRWLSLAIFAVISVPYASARTDHQTPEDVTAGQQITTRPVAPLQICPRPDKKYDPKITDYQGKKISLVENDGDKPTLVIIASADSKDAVLEFLSAFATPIWSYRKKSRIFNAVRGQSGQFLSDYWYGDAGWWGSLDPAWKNFKNEMGKMEDLRVLIFADARPIYKEKLEDGLDQAEQERKAAIERGRQEGIKKGEQIGAEKGREYSLPFFRHWLGIAEKKGRQKGRVEGARQGSEIGAKVADMIIPPYVTFVAESELTKQADELLPQVKTILENRLVKDFDKQSWISILIDEKDFARGLTEKGRKGVEWANSFLDKDKRLDPTAAIEMHASFMKKTNSAEEIMKGLLGSSKPGFHVVLLDPNGNPLQAWSDKQINAETIAAEYLKYLEHLQGVKQIVGCPAMP